LNEGILIKKKLAERWERDDLFSRFAEVQVLIYCQWTGQRTKGEKEVEEEKKSRKAARE